MSNTSTNNDKTVADDAKVKLIIGEIGRDTQTGIIGRGYSFDNGRTFHVTDTIYGRLYDDRDVDGVWNNGMHEKVKEKVNQEITNTVEPAIKQADSAVAYANEAIEKSRVNSQAIVDINSAVSDAVSDAAVARSDGLRAWNAAQSNVDLIDSNYASASAAISSARTEAFAAADEAKASASAAQADIVAVRSDVAAVQAGVATTRSDVAVAKSDIADTKTSLASQAKSLSSYAAQASAEYASTASALSDAKTELSSDVAVAKNLANTAQTTADNAIKSASSVADDLTKVASQAKANVDGITKVTSDVGLLQTTVANNTGDISTIQETAKQIQQAVSDNAGNITVAKQTADSAVAVASDARSNATVAVQTASQASITASNASGQAASAVITANGAMTTANNAQSNATVAVQTASGASLTAINANSDATVAKQTASEAKIQASNAESDFAQLSIRAGKIEASVANNSGAIASVQQTANGLTTTVGNVDDRVKKIEDNTNWTTKTGALDMDTLTTTQNIYYRDSNLKNADGETGWAYIQVVSMGERVTQTVWHDRSSIQHTRTGAIDGSTYDWDAWNKVATNAQVVEVKNTVDGIATIINDPKTGLNATYQTATGNATTISNIKGDVSQLKVSASSASAALSDAAGNISSLQASAKSYSAALSDTNSNVASVTATASKLETKYADAAGDISQLQTDAKGMTQTISDAQGDIAKLKIRADGFDTQFADTKGDISKLQVDASGTKQTLTNAKSDIAVLQSRADGFDAKYADTADDINTIKVNAKGMQQTLTDAKGDISTLQATATGFKNTLTDAQGNISTLQSDVSGLKKTTSDHAGNIATLQADAKTLTSQMSSAQGDISTLKRTSSGFSSKVSGMETSLANANSKIDGITSNGGGRNLLCNSIGKFQPNLSKIDNWMSYATSPVYMTQGQQYTVHANASDGLVWSGTHDNSKESNNVVLWLVDGRSVNQIISDANTDTRTTFTWNHPSGTYCLRVNTYKSDNSGYAERVMLEKGTIAHDWSPAPEDTDAKITTNATAIEHNKKAIALKADQTVVDKTNGTVQQLQAQLKVQSDQIAAKVSSSDLPNLVGKGGRNLLTGTSGDWITKTATGWMNVTTANSNKTSVADYHTGDSFTYSATVTNKSDTNVRLEMYGCDSNGTRISDVRALSDYVAPNTTAKRISCTIAINSNTWFVEHTLIANGDSTSKTVQIKGEMFETGTIAHDWQPAPEDTQTYTQTQIKQTADSWNANLTSVKNGLTDKYTNLHATVDGIQAQVYNSDGSSRITQLSDLIATKVSQGDYNSQITQLKDDINLRVTKGNVVSQINQEAGGNTLIQVSNGKGKLALNASSVIFSGSAFIPDAYISTLNADKLRFYDSSGNVATMSAGLEQYDDDKSNKTIVLQYSGGYEVHASELLGSILTMHDNSIRLAVKANGMASSGSNDQYSGFYAMPHYAQLSCYRSDGKAPGIYITDDSYEIRGDDSGSGTKYGDLKIMSPQIYITGGNSVSVSGSNAVQMQAGNVHAWLSNDGIFNIYKDNDGGSTTATKLQVNGWAWVRGWVEAAGHSQHSALSTKTDIQPVDDDKMLKMVNDTDLATFLYKTDVANGETHRHIGLIIDDVHDVAQYQTPQDFIAPNGVSRDDDNMIGALFGAVKALTKRIKTLESKVG